MPKLGIDFGTTNSLMVAYDREKNKFLYFSGDAFDPKPISSTIMYHDGNEVIGAEAREKMSEFADFEGYHFERSIKLKLGTNQLVNVLGDAKKPSDIASSIIAYLKNTAVNKFNAVKTGVDINRSVFTVPINFNGKARMDLRDAARNAGIEVSTFIHEPFAAIVGYFFTKDGAGTSCENILSQLDELNNQYILTFDWGGGTLDITVVQVKNGKMIEIGTAELTNVAGDKFDEDLSKYIWDEFCTSLGGKYDSEYLEKIRKVKWGKMLASAERCKIQLSKYEDADFYVDNIIDDIGIDTTIERSTFEEKVLASTLDAAMNKIDEALLAAGIQDVNLHHVLLTGGTCYIPAVQERMRQKFGHRVANVKGADLLIAQGAAVISELGWLPFLTKDIQIEMCNDSYYALIENGTPIASEAELLKEEVFTCVDQRQKNAKVIITEGIGQKMDSTLAILNVPTLGDHRFGDDICVEARLDKNIVLNISARSLMVHGYGMGQRMPDEQFSIRKNTEIYKLCFGLDFKR